MLRNAAVAIGLLGLGAAACSGSSDSSTSSASESVAASAETAVTNTDVGQTVPSSSQSSSIPTSTVPSTVTPAGGSTTGPSSSVDSRNSPPSPTTATTNPSPAPGPAAINPSPEPTTAPAAPVAGLLNGDCTKSGAAGFDLIHAQVVPGPSTYRFSARYSGNASQHDIVVSFDLGASTYVVSGELFEDGTGVGQVAGAAASETTFLDPPQTIVPGNVELNVQRSQIASISGTPFAVTVSLKVDGTGVETCP